MSEHRTTQLRQLQTIASSLNSVALTKLVRFAQSIQQQSTGKKEARSNRMKKEEINDWRVGQ